MAKPLYDIMGPSATFSWGTEQEKAFDALRQKLMEAPGSEWSGTVNWFWQLRPRLCAAQLLYYQERAISGGAIYKAFQTLPFGTTFYSED